ISITNVNDAPTLANVASSAQYTEEGAAATLSSAASVSDPDNVKLVGATVSIIGGTFAGDGDVLATSTSGTSITASYNAATETLTLSGPDTRANYQTVLDKITFSAAENPTNYGSNPTRTVTWVLNDGSGSFNLSTAQTTTVTITNVNDAPTLTGTAGSVSFTENGASVVLSPSVTVADPDNLKLVSATVSITGGSFAGDVLAANTAGTSITASYDSATETLTLTGSDTLADYRTVLDSITFNSTSDNPTNYGSNPTRTVTWVLNDGASSFNLSTAQTETINITAINDAPTLSGVATSLTVTPAVATTISPTLSVSDPDNQTLASATVSITRGTFANDGDVPDADTTGTSITASYDSTTERLVLTGSDSLANYKQVLDSVTFDATGADPTNGGANQTRTLTWVANDGSGSFSLSAAATTTITIQNGPAINPPASVNYTEEGGSITLAPSLVVSDSDGSTHLVSATVQITGGTFAGDADVVAADTTGPSTPASYASANERLVLTGSDTLANYQAVLDRVTFIADENPNNFGSDPTRTVVWTVVDDTAGTNNTGHATSTINITNINDQPTLAIGNTAASWVEEQPPTGLAPTVAVSDPDNLNLASATVQITGGTFTGDADVLAADTTGTSITASYNSSTETLTLTGSDTLAHYQTVLDSITFNAGENPTDFGSDATRTLTWTLNDGSGSFATSAAQTSTVSITNVNDAPTLSNAAVTDSYTASQTITLAPSASVFDPDSLDLAGATVAIASGSFAGDGDGLAANTAGTGITASYDTTSQTLTLSGADTLAHYQQVLDSVTFSSAAADPGNGGSDPTRTVTWVLNDGSGSFNLSAAQTTTISIHAGP